MARKQQVTNNPLPKPEILPSWRQSAPGRQRAPRSTPMGQPQVASSTDRRDRGRSQSNAPTAISAIDSGSRGETREQAAFPPNSAPTQDGKLRNSQKLFF